MQWLSVSVCQVMPLLPETLVGNPHILTLKIKQLRSEKLYVWSISLDFL